MFSKTTKSFPQTSASGVEYLIVGLGNPGKNYEYTRHNAGFLAVDQIAAECGAKIDRLKFKSLTAAVDLSGKKALLMKPSTFMNKSGEAVVEAMQFYKIPIEKVIVVYDDITLDVGRMRIRLKGSDGGHNGIKSILYLTCKDTFPRVKLGVGQKPHPDYDLADWVLSRFTKTEFSVFEKVLESAQTAVRLLVDGKANDAMNRFN